LFLGEPQTTPYDLNFSFFGFPVRISAWFWLTGLLFGANVITNAEVAPWRAFLLWTSAIFISILIHEVGHCLAFKKHGLASRIVLYHFGGLAIPSGWGGGGGRSSAQNPWSQIEISAAGPVLQILSAIVLAALIGAFGFVPPSLEVFPFLGGFDGILSSFQGEKLPPIDLFYFANYYVWVSIGWGIFNLLPIYPLDGGQIARNLGVLMFGNEGIRYSLMLSIGVGAYVAYTSYTSGSTLMAFMFASFAYSSYQALQASYGSYRPW